MPDSTNVPGAVSILVRGVGHVTLRPEWRRLLDAACSDLSMTYTDIVRTAAADFPEPNRAEATRLWIASYFMTRAAQRTLAESLSGLQIPLPPYILPE